MFNKKQNNEEPFEEKRKDKRIVKHFILTYFDKAHPHVRYELTQLKNISKGGMCFVTSQAFKPSMKMGIELKTPYISETTFLEGEVLESHEKIKNMVYETRLKFDLLDPQAEFMIEKLIEYFENETTGEA